MELKEFIKQALTEIVEATMEAKDELKNDVAICCHTNKEYLGHPSVAFTTSTNKTWQAPLTVVNFKVQLEVEDTTTIDGNVKAGLLKVASVSAGGGTVRSSSTTQEVSFSIPLVWGKKMDK